MIDHLTNCDCCDLYMYNDPGNNAYHIDVNTIKRVCCCEGKFGF